MRFASTAFAIILTLAAPFSAQASVGDLLVEGMEPSDYTMMNEAARGGLDGKQPGEQTTWQNADSGNSGVAKLQALEEQDGLPCRVVAQSVSVAKTGQSTSIISRICKKDGKWLLAPKE